MPALRIAAWVLLIFLASFPTSAAEKEPPFHAGYRKGTLDVPTKTGTEARTMLLWYPTQAKAAAYNYQGQNGFAAFEAEVAPGKHPVVLFSHGYLGTADQTIFLLEEFARQGYIVAAINHADSLKVKKKEPLTAPEFADAKKWDDSKFRERRDDLTTLLEHLLKEDSERNSPLYHHLNRQQIAGCGHSLGGYTILGMVGGWKSWHDPRLKAGLLLSPYALPFIEQGNVTQISVPVMFQGGTLDWGITPFLRPVFNQVKSPKYFLILKLETHFGWTNLASLGKTTTATIEQGNPQLMTEYSVAFLKHHLQQQPQPMLREKNSKLASYWEER